MEDRKGQIIQVATDFIKKYGYDSFSYKDLSEAVGITKATLHHHFAKKEDLGVAVLQVIKDQLAYLRQKTFEIEDSKKRLYFFFTSLKGTIEKNDICPISSMQAEFNVIPDSLKNMIAEISSFEVELLTDILTEGKEDGSFEYDDAPKETALIMMTSYKGAIMYSRTMDTPVLDTVLKGIYNIVNA